MKLLFLTAALATQPQASGEFTLLMKGLIVGEESWTAGESRQEFREGFEFLGESCGAACSVLQRSTWGRSFFRIDDKGWLEAAMVPTPYAPLVAVRKGRESEYGAVLAAAARAGLAQVSSPAERNTLAIVGANVLDVTDGSFRKKATVVVREGRVAAIGDSGLAIPDDAERIDARGLTLLPGLWDMHAHLKQVEWLPAYLAAGVTTVRDLGNEMEFLVSLREGLADRPAAGPRVFAAGFIDATPSQGPPYTSAVADTPEQGRELVRRYLSAGFDAIKVWGNVSPETLSAVTEEAHTHRLSVTGHVPGGLTPEDAISQGLDQIDHVAFLGDLETDAGRKRVEKLRAAQTVVDPTLVVVRYATRPKDQPLSSFEPCAEWMPPELVKVWSAFGVPPSEARAGEAQLERSLAAVRALHQAGVPLVAGSDQGLPGCTLLLELELYVRTGLSPLDAIRSATLVPARVMGVEDESGSIAVGKRADLILVERDPLEDIHALRSLRYVIRDGTLLDPAELRRLADLVP